MIGSSLRSSTGYLKNEAKDFPADLLGCRFAGGDSACVNFHQVVPACREIGSGGDLDHRRAIEAADQKAGDAAGNVPVKSYDF